MKKRVYLVFVAAIFMEKSLLTACCCGDADDEILKVNSLFEYFVECVKSRKFFQRDIDHSKKQAMISAKEQDEISKMLDILWGYICCGEDEKIVHEAFVRLIGHNVHIFCTEKKITIKFFAKKNEILSLDKSINSKYGDTGSSHSPREAVETVLMPSDHKGNRLSAAPNVSSRRGVDAFVTNSLGLAPDASCFSKYTRRNDSNFSGDSPLPGAISNASSGDSI